MQALSKVTNLKHLNLQHSSVDDQRLKSLTLKNLETFVCGNTNVSGKRIRKMCQRNHKLTKLSISGLNGNGSGLFQTEYLVEIQKALPKLTHLNIRNYFFDI